MLYFSNEPADVAGRMLHLFRTAKGVNSDISKLRDTQDFLRLRAISEGALAVVAWERAGLPWRGKPGRKGKNAQPSMFKAMQTAFENGAAGLMSEATAKRIGDLAGKLAAHDATPQDVRDALASPEADSETVAESLFRCGLDTQAKLIRLFYGAEDAADALAKLAKRVASLSPEDRAAFNAHLAEADAAASTGADAAASAEGEAE